HMILPDLSCDLPAAHKAASVRPAGWAALYAQPTATSRREALERSCPMSDDPTTTHGDNDELMTVRVAAHRLNVSPATMHKRIGKGMLPAVPGRHGKLVRLSDVLPLADQTHHPPSRPSLDTRLAEQGEALEGMRHAVDALSARIDALEQGVESLR